MAYRSLWENDAKELKFLILSESRVNWNEDIKWQTEAIIVEISYSNLETVRYSPKSEVSQIIRESWQHCCLPNSFPKFFYVVWKKCLVEIFVWCQVGFFGPLLKISLLKLSSFVNEDIQIMVTLTKWIRHPLHSSFNRGVPWINFLFCSKNGKKLIKYMYIDKFVVRMECESIASVPQTSTFITALF